MDLGRLSRRYLVVAFFACLWIVALDAFPTKGPFSAKQEAHLRPHRQYSRDSNTTLGKSTTIWAVACVYPVSGIYTRMQRLLLYVVTAFVFLLRSYNWLIAVGMTFVLTYASAACIHAFLLNFLDGIGPDVDVLALQGIILSMTVAICCYSIGSRRISEYPSAPLFYMWISALLVTSMALFVHSSAITGEITTFIVPAGCSADGECSPGACSNATSHGLFRREMDQLVPMELAPWMYYNASIQSDSGGYNYSPLYLSYFVYVGSMYVFIVLRLVVTPLLFNPSKIRNVVFFYFLAAFKIPEKRFCLGPLAFFLASCLSRIWIRRAKAMKHFLFYDLSSASEVKPRHIYIAKLLASCWFVCSWSARIILLMLPVVTVILSELPLAGLPESEAPRLVGQWAPFVYVGLALLASLILKFLNHRRAGVQEQRRLIDISYPDSTEPSKSPLRLYLNPYSIGKEFKTWWNDPVNVAKQDYMGVRRQLRFELIAARRRAAKIRQEELSCVVVDEDAETADAEPAERPQFDKLWERLSASASESQNHKNWSTQIPSTFAICRGDNHRNSLADTGWITATYEEEEYETISTAEIRRREAKSQKDREDREHLAESLETVIGDILELGGFELR